MELRTNAHSLAHSQPLHKLPEIYGEFILTCHNVLKINTRLI